MIKTPKEARELREVAIQVSNKKQSNEVAKHFKRTGSRAKPKPEDQTWIVASGSSKGQSRSAAQVNEIEFSDSEAPMRLPGTRQNSAVSGISEGGPGPSSRVASIGSGKNSRRASVADWDSGSDVEGRHRKRSMRERDQPIDREAIDREGRGQQEVCVF